MILLMQVFALKFISHLSIILAVIEKLNTEKISVDFILYQKLIKFTWCFTKVIMESMKTRTLKRIKKGCQKISC